MLLLNLLFGGSNIAREIRNTVYGYAVAHPWLPWTIPCATWIALSAIRLTLTALRTTVPLDPSVSGLLAMVTVNAGLSVPLFGWPVATHYSSGSLLTYAALHALLYVHSINICNAAFLGTPVIGMVLGAVNLSIMGWTIGTAVWIHPVWLRSEWPELQLCLYRLYAIVLPVLTVPQVTVLMIAAVSAAASADDHRAANDSYYS